MMLYSYKLDHDYGFAPNPFGGYCTLANCKPDIRRNKKLQIGDWIIGTGSKKLNLVNHVIYVMQVSEKITYNEYWNDPRFQYKKPVINGSLVEIYGDNIYHFDENRKRWRQENSAHSLAKGKLNKKHLETDTGGGFVLISTNFYYFGSNCFLMPEKYREICNQGRNIKSTSIPEKTQKQFITWVQKKFKPGIHGDPINWREHLKK